MSEDAIKKLRRSYTLVAMGSLAITMLLVSGLLYLGSSWLNRQSIKSTLNYIAENDGELVVWEESDESTEDSGQYIRFLEDIFSTNSEYQSSEFKFQTRYFAVLFDSDGNISEVKTSHIASVTEEEAETYGKQALGRRFSFGRIENYYYKVRIKDDGSSVVVYMDSSSAINSNNRMLYLALILIGFGMIVAFVLVRISSSKVIQKEMRMAELQKQFMTNASHELKTPLAVIRANTEMQEMLDGESEWTQSNMRQVERMNGLIQNLVMITRADENRGHTDVDDVEMSRVIKETTKNFQSLAIQSGKKLTMNIDEDVKMRAEEAQMRQICSLLVDNAIKYCDDGGEISVALNQKGKNITLVVSNTYAEGKNVDYSKFFERFYREDSSHNTDKGGYGIGLSIAESLVKQYHGTINASWKNDVISFTCQLKSI